MRWNTGFAYLDPVRDESRIHIIDQALVDRLELRGSTVRRAHVLRGRERLVVEADRFVLCGGTYGSPEVLLRSGVGPVGELRALGVHPCLDLPGVGRNLHDHPMLELRFEASDELARRLADYERLRPLPDEQAIGKARSTGGRAAPYNLHLLPWTTRTADGWACVLSAACLTPRSRGTLWLSSLDPTSKPVIDHAYLTNQDGADLGVLRDGIDLCRRMAAFPGLAPRLGTPLDEFSAHPRAGAAAMRSFRRPLLASGGHLRDRRRSGRGCCGRRYGARARQRQPLGHRRPDHARDPSRYHQLARRRARLASRPRSRLNRGASDGKRLGGQVRRRGGILELVTY